MKGSRSAGVLVGVFALTNAAPALAQQARLTAPENWIESAPPGSVECKDGLQSQISNSDYRRFVARNQIWPQSGLVDKDWKAGKVLSQPQLRYPQGATDLPKVIEAELHFLVGENGKILDAVVRCTNAPSLNEAIIELVPNFRFRPTQYQGRDVVTVFPVRVVLRH